MFLNKKIRDKISTEGGVIMNMEPLAKKLEPKSLNDVFNNMITSLTNVNKNNVTLWDVTNFYRYYTQIKQQLF